MALFVVIYWHESFCMSLLDWTKGLIRTILKSKKLKKYFKKNVPSLDFIDVPGQIFVTYPENIVFGKGLYLGPECFLDARGGLIFGDNIIIAPRVMIFTYNHDFFDPYYTPYGPGILVKKVIIGSNVWIGAGVIIKPGASIGDNCIISSGSVVSGVIPSNSIAAGNPCVFVKPFPQKNTDAIQYEVVMSQRRRWG